MNTADRVRRRSRHSTTPIEVARKIDEYPSIALWDNFLRLRWERLFPEAQA